VNVGRPADLPCPSSRDGVEGSLRLGPIVSGGDRCGGGLRGARDDVAGG
jgi:hypothetical protein